MFIIKALALGLAFAYDGAMVAKLRMWTHSLEKPTPEEIEARYNESRHRGDLIPEWHKEVDQFLQKEEEDGQCKECVMKVTKIIMEKAFDKMEAWCKDDDDRCPVKRKLCWLLAKAPKVLCGMMVHWVRPMADGWFLCVGKGLCQPKEDNNMKEENILSLEGDTRAVVDEMGLDSTMTWGTLDLESESDIQVFQQMDEIAIDDAFMEEEKAIAAFGGEENDQGPKPCKKCMKKVTCCVMHHVIKKIVEWCKKDENNKKRACMCNWMKNHKAFTFGYLLASVEPWKFAYGYCLPHDKPHHKKWSPRESKWKMLHKLHGSKWGGYLPADKAELTGMTKPEKPEHIWE